LGVTSVGFILSISYPISFDNYIYSFNLLSFFTYNSVLIIAPVLQCPYFMLFGT
jgi:hypothetical protein